MKKYNVLVEATLGRNITVMARDEDHAREIVQIAYEAEKIALTTEDITSVYIGDDEWVTEGDELDELSVF